MLCCRYGLATAVFALYRAYPFRHTISVAFFRSGSGGAAYIPATYPCDSNFCTHALYVLCCAVFCCAMQCHAGRSSPQPCGHRKPGTPLCTPVLLLLVRVAASRRLRHWQCMRQCVAHAKAMQRGGCEQEIQRASSSRESVVEGKSVPLQVAGCICSDRLFKKSQHRPCRCTYDGMRCRPAVRLLRLEEVTRQPAGNQPSQCTRGLVDAIAH